MDWGRIQEILTSPIFNIGKTPVSLAMLSQFVLLVVFVFVLSSISRKMLRRRILPATRLEIGLQDAIARIVGYLILVLGMMIVLSTLGFDLTSLTVLAGALGVGLGFGLQNIVENFVSGLIILGERPIQIGHRIVVGEDAGQVTRIGARSTSILTNDNITLIIPNSQFISQRVINWSHGGDRRVRFKIPVGVSYASNPYQVEKLLLEVANKDANVLNDPTPSVVFLEFGDSSLNFELRVWTEGMSQRPGAFRGEMNFAIWDILKKNNIQIPFPQRDLHFKGPLQLEKSLTS